MTVAHRRRPIDLALHVLIASGLLAGAAAAVAAPEASATTAPTATTAVERGADVSWPNCPQDRTRPPDPLRGKPMPTGATRFVVIGVTGGHAFSRNDCLATQVAWARQHHQLTAAYVVTSYPSAAQLASYGAAGPYRGTSLLTRLRNVGWAQARSAVATMRQAGLGTPMVWLDIEYMKLWPWSRSRTDNRAVVEGAVAAYRSAGLRVGFYSTQRQWNDILGVARYGAPEWHTAGATSAAAALRACTTRSFQGGPTLVAQWWDATTDHDVLCPGRVPSGSVTRWFTRY